ncbi:MAG: ABC transporter permease [Rikenellaceae bacterium]
MMMKRLFKPVTDLLAAVGRYTLLLGKIFTSFEKPKIYRGRVLSEMEALGIDSIGLTTIISFFIGAVVTLQMSINMKAGFIPQYLIGYATREVMILEFSSTVVALILSGKIGSNIASEIGTMRITEQIDALEIMGVNSASYLILPKIIATVLFFPLLTILSIFIGIIGGYVISAATSVMIPADYLEGLLYDFKPYSIVYSLIKSAVFGFVITTVSAFCGYYVGGNSLEVGRASTRAVVASSVVVMIFNLILTQLLLT